MAAPTEADPGAQSVAVVGGGLSTARSLADAGGAVDGVVSLADEFGVAFETGCALTGDPSG